MADELTIHRDNASYNRMRQAAWFSSVVPKPGTEKGPLQVDTRLGDRRVGATNPLGPQQPPWTGAETGGPGHGSGFSFLILELVSGESRSRSSCSPSGVGFSSHSRSATLRWCFYVAQSLIYDVSHKHLDPGCPDCTNPNHPTRR